MFLKLFLFLILSFSPYLYAKEKRLFRASYINFFIEGDWTCKNFHIEWICHHQFSNSVQPAFILIGAEEAKNLEQFDTFSNFVDDLSQKGSLLNDNLPKKLKIHKFDWVRSFKQGKFPLQEYYQIEVTTVCCKASPRRARVSVSFQARVKDFSKYSGIFSNTIMSLRLDKNITQLVEDIRQYGNQNPKTTDYIQQILSEMNEEEEREIHIDRDWGFLEDEVFQFLCVLILLSLLWWYLDKRKMQKKKQGNKQEKKLRRRRSSSSRTVRHSRSRT